MIKAFCKPRIKVGTEWVTKGQTCEQATNAVGGIARAIFDRVFKWLIIKCNDTLIDPTMKKANFCAVLDIAGFEIFEYNGFEQISINFVNEKLRQFFNHHMFVVEQEEYVREGIDWVMVDFGMDLAAAIIMFEKPMGIWAILEEESLFPKATDKSFEEKLKASLGKLPVFLKPNSKTDKNAHFAVSHYAGIVNYNVTNWLEKNKDPVNDTVVELFKSTSSCKLLVHLWRDHPGQPQTAPKEEGKKKKKGGGGKTVSSVYLVSLGELMTTLYNCEPHFVRCLVPNNHKKPGEVEPPLIMHQLTCNGVLEGIRICMRGFPNRMLYPDFKMRYACLGQEAIKSSGDNKTAVYALMDKIAFDRERYRLGHTLVFFRAGALAGLEEKRDELVIKWIRMIQGEVYKRIRGKEFAKRRDQRELIKVCQRNFRKFLAMRDWGWFIIIQKRNLDSSKKKPMPLMVNTKQLWQPLPILRAKWVLTISGIGFFFEESKFLFRIGKPNQSSSLLNNDKPSPVSHGKELSEVSLANLNQFSLISPLCKFFSSNSLIDFSLDHSDPFDDKLITFFFKTSKGTSSEEDKCVSKSVSLPVKGNLVHQGINCCLVITRAGNLCLTKASISHLEVWVEHTIWESSHTDSNTLKHTITSKLVHNKWGFNFSRLLVIVWYKATDKVRFTVIECCHKLTKRNKIYRGDSLTTATLLFLLAFFLWCSCWLSWMISPQMYKKFAR